MNNPAKYFVAPKPSVKVYPDGREVCNLRVKAGKQEYYTRTIMMLERQKMLCAICLHGIHYIWAEFDHEAGRGSGGGHRDDRIEVDGHWQNAAVCRGCNSRKGSQRYHWVDGKYIPKTS
jgi:hypothetical protein